MKIQMKGMSLMVILLMLALTVQAAALRGTVTDKATKEPLIGAAVQLSGTSTGAITDMDGNFELAGLRNGTYKLIISYISYCTQTVEVTINGLLDELDWAEDGQICLDKFQKSSAGHYDAILMDIRMPHMTGYEATKAIRGINHPDALSIPIIAMSADAFSDDIQHCLECGMNAHIAKPIDVIELTRLLKRYLI